MPSDASIDWVLADNAHEVSALLASGVDPAVSKPIDESLLNYCIGVSATRVLPVLLVHVAKHADEWAFYVENKQNYLKFAEYVFEEGKENLASKILGYVATIDDYANRISAALLPDKRVIWGSMEGNVSVANILAVLNAPDGLLFGISLKEIKEDNTKDTRNLIKEKATLWFKSLLRKDTSINETREIVELCSSLYEFLSNTTPLFRAQSIFEIISTDMPITSSRKPFPPGSYPRQQGAYPRQRIPDSILLRRTASFGRRQEGVLGYYKFSRVILSLIFWD